MRLARCHRPRLDWRRTRILRAAATSDALGEVNAPEKDVWPAITVAGNDVGGQGREGDRGPIGIYGRPIARVVFGIASLTDANDRRLAVHQIAPEHTLMPARLSRHYFRGCRAEDYEVAVAAEGN